MRLLYAGSAAGGKTSAGFAVFVQEKAEQ